MKQKMLLLSASAGILFLVLQSNSQGPGNISKVDATGRLGPSSDCKQCHIKQSTSAVPTTCVIELRKKSAGPNSAIVTSYLYDSTYYVRIKGANSDFSKFGFQLTTANVGTFSVFPSGVDTAVANPGSIVVVEQTAVINSPDSFQKDFQWKAPSSGSTNAIFYGIVNAADGNNADSLDKTSNRVSTILYPTSVIELENLKTFKAYPNPCKAFVNLSVENASAGAYTINVFDFNGRKLYSTIADHTVGNLQVNIGAEKWAAGTYMVQIVKEGVPKVISVVKQ
jgi:hypothetical protein